MKVSYEWLKTYVDLPVTPDELADKVSRTGIEVEDVYYPSKGLKNLVIGHVLSTKEHPDSDHLTICQVDVGEDEPIQIICGAPNVASGQYVITALPGARIADNQKIKKGKIRGEVSNGMLCALQEIGFSESVAPHKYADGIFVFPEEVPVGQSVFPYLGMEDAILDFDITPNRADAMGMRGVAREISAVYDEPFKFPEYHLEESSEKASDLLTVNISADTPVLAYEIRILDHVQIKESPLWLQIRLWNAGIRPINNVVDVTNYILMSFGQPMHAFDYDKLGTKELLVRMATDKETITTLDGEKQELTADDIVITNGETPAAVAGVMGGLDTEIQTTTQRVVLESAIFEPTHIRKTAQRLNLRSESSARFERGVNPSDVHNALDAAATLIAQLGNGAVLTGPIIAKKPNTEKKIVTISIDRINHVLGTELAVETVQDIFKRLDFDTLLEDGLFSVGIPPRRGDISIEADLIEEVARLYGFDNLPSTLPTGGMTPGALTFDQAFKRQTRHLMESAGLNQVISYALITEEKTNRFLMAPSAITKLDFPMTEDHSVLRLNLISGLLDDIAYNIARKQTDLFFYEQGRVFSKDSADIVRPSEIEHLAGAITGDRIAASWHGKKKAVDFYTLKGILERYFASIDFVDTIRFEKADQYSDMHPGRTANIYLGDALIGFIGQVHPNLAKSLKINETYVFEIDLSQLINASEKSLVYQPIGKFPRVTRDMALLLDDSITHQQVLDVVNETHGAYLVDIQLFDVFSGEKLGIHKKSMAYTLTYENKEATLTDDIVNKDFEKITQALADKLGATTR